MVRLNRLKLMFTNTQNSRMWRKLNLIISKIRTISIKLTDHYVEITQIEEIKLNIKFDDFDLL